MYICFGLPISVFKVYLLTFSRFAELQISIVRRVVPSHYQAVNFVGHPAGLSTVHRQVARAPRLAVVGAECGADRFGEWH